MNRLDEGIIKWATLGACIGALEFFGEESLTHAYERALNHDKMKYIALGGLALTGAHLLGILPREIDPFYMIQDRINNE